MRREFASPRSDHATQQPVISPQDRVVLLLLDALQELADAGEVDAACRIAGNVCVILRRAAPRDERRFNALLHRLTPRLGARDPREGDM